MNSTDQRNVIAQLRETLNGKHVRVLLLEDDPNDAHLTLEVLIKREVQPTWARTIEEAKSRINSDDFKIVFLDLKLDSGRSGLELISHIRHTKPDCWVVVLSGVYTEDSAECKEALRLGACAVMLKPLTQEKLQLIFGIP